MRVRGFVGVLSGVLLAMGLVAAPSVAAEPVTVTATWSCTVPSGYIYVQVRQSLNCSAGLGTEYLVQPPVDGIWSCNRPAGYTYTQGQDTLLCSSSGQLVSRYYIRVPVVGMWACSVPSGWSYSATQQTLLCSAAGLRTRYQLRRL